MRSLLGFALVGVARRHRGAVAEEFEALGLYVGQEMLLSRLWEQDGQSQAALARACGIEGPTVTKAVARMERQGLVVRGPDPVDGRVSRVSLTDAGRNLEASVARSWRSVEERMLTGMSQRDVAAALRLLRRMHDNLEPMKP